MTAPAPLPEPGTRVVVTLRGIDGERAGTVGLDLAGEPDVCLEDEVSVDGTVWGVAWLPHLDDSTCRCPVVTSWRPADTATDRARCTAALIVAALRDKAEPLNLITERPSWRGGSTFLDAALADLATRRAAGESIDDPRVDALLLEVAISAGLTDGDRVLPDGRKESTP